MSIKTIVIPESALVRAVQSTTSRAFSGDFDAAYAVSHQMGLNEAQRTKTAAILKEGPHAAHEDQAAQTMNQRIIVVVGGDNDPSAATLNERYVSFSDDTTSSFGNAFPCRIEFGGKHYQNATACFLAEQYTDQPEIMNLFTNLDSEAAAALAKRTPMTEERKISWDNPQAEPINKDQVLMNVLRAKFGQNPDLKDKLLETGTAYLVCHGHGFYLSNNKNGTGINALGASLMRLRAEYGGKGEAEPPVAFLNAMQSLQTRCHSVTNDLCSDILERFLFSYLSQCDLITLTAVACVNKHWNNSSTKFWDKRDLKQLCPELTVLDANAQGVTCEDEPEITKLRLLKWVKKLSSHVERKAGVTLLTMTKGTTLNQLIEIAKGEGMTVEVLWDRIIPELGDVPIEQTYGILITNSVFKYSRQIDYSTQKILVEGQGCEMPTVQEYVALCVFTNKVFKKCLYGKNPRTYGRSSTHIGEFPLIVGFSFIAQNEGVASTRLFVRHSRYDHDDRGAGGQKKF
jgi:predicted NAD-dependent protein-ADP-ribosyltransferase YbiA (DUF1768 family)